jgi:hypothetical protein
MGGDRGHVLPVNRINPMARLGRWRVAGDHGRGEPGPQRTQLAQHPGEDQFVAGIPEAVVAADHHSRLG